MCYERFYLFFRSAFIMNKEKKKTVFHFYCYLIFIFCSSVKKPTTVHTAEPKIAVS